MTLRYLIYNYIGHTFNCCIRKKHNPKKMYVFTPANSRNAYTTYIIRTAVNVHVCSTNLTAVRVLIYAFVNPRNILLYYLNTVFTSSTVANVVYLRM